MVAWSWAVFYYISICAFLNMFWFRILLSRSDPDVDASPYEIAHFTKGKTGQ